MGDASERKTRIAAHAHSFPARKFVATLIFFASVCPKMLCHALFFIYCVQSLAHLLEQVVWNVTAALRDNSVARRSLDTLASHGLLLLASTSGWPDERDSQVDAQGF